MKELQFTHAILCSENGIFVISCPLNRFLVVWCGGHNLFSPAFIEEDCRGKMSTNPELVEQSLTLSNVAYVPGFLPDGTIGISCVIGKNDRVDVNGSTRI